MRDAWLTPARALFKALSAGRARALLQCAWALAALSVALAAPAQTSLGPATGLADADALRSTVFGTPPKSLAPLPERVPLEEMDLKLPRAQPVPALYWFDRRLRVWLARQRGPAPLAIVIGGTGNDANSSNLKILRGILYGAGYHVLTLPSPTFPGFIVSASSTGVAGDLQQDGHDLYAAMQAIVAHLPRRMQITDVDLVGISLGGANAAVVKALDAPLGKLKIHRCVMINPPVSMFTSIARLDQLFAISIGSGDQGVENLYRRLYARLANQYLRSNSLSMDDTDLMSAAATVLRSNADFAAAIALTFRLALVDVFFAGDLYARTGVVVNPQHPPQVGDSLERIGVELRAKPFSEYFNKVFVPYYSAHRAGANAASLMADNRLDLIAQQLRSDGDYYVLSNSDDPILNKAELSWLQSTMGSRIVVYDHGGHLGNLGDQRQAGDLLQMLAGHWMPTP